MLVFANKRDEADYISRRLGAQGWSVDSMHGKDDSREREKILKRFRNKEVTVLISTDILSRGLDCADLNCVVNWGMPRRSARALPPCRAATLCPFLLHVHKPRFGPTPSVGAMRARGTLGHSHGVI